MADQNRRAVILDLIKHPSLLSDEEVLYFAKYPLVEEIPYDLYDTQTFVPGLTLNLIYFDRRSTEQQSNMLVGYQLLEPWAFRLYRIRVFGLRQALNLGIGKLVLGARSYGASPLWRYGLRERHDRRNPLFIPPRLNFTFTCAWDWSDPKAAPAPFPLQVVFCGALLRPKY